MNNACMPKRLRPSSKRAGVVVASFAMLAGAQAASTPTDITQTPLIVTSSAQAKPNIMLLMDNSGSMGRTHMPDEVENITGVKSIGYKSPQCNALYYSPTGTYLLPKKYDGSPFPVPDFNAAPYAGYGAFFVPPDATPPTNLNSEFVPYDWGRNTVLGPVGAPTSGPSAGFAAATPGAAFYYTYSGPEPLKYDAAPCTQRDTGASVATPGGGVWTRVDVSTRPLAEKKHFALWYSFYRTRLGLTKSAASLAFSPLDASKRVGFITVEPKANPNDASIDPSRYLQVDDFDTSAGAQKENWYKKLFSQVPSGASPTREGLARVGRYYGGKTDQINTGMVNTGPRGPDPVLLACQQNFTILTTDGYWNAQTQSPGGGGVKLDGTTLVGQQDGNPACNVSDPYCVRPIFDGNSADIRNVTNKTNNYTSVTCSLNTTYRHRDQQQRKVFNITRDTTRTQQETIQYKRTSSQLVAKSEQTVKTVKQTTRTVDQYYIETNTPTQERYQIMMSQDKIVRDTEQFQRQTRQQTAQTLKNTEVVTQTTEQDEQWQTASTQYGIVTTQFRTSTSNFSEGKQQVYKRQWQWIGSNGAGETSAPLPTSACPAGYTCAAYDILSTQLVDPATCPSSSVGPYNADPTLSYVHTDCTPGPLASAYGPVAACSAGVTPGTPDPATGPNGWVRTTCNRVNSAPDYAAGYTVASCVPSSQSGTSPYTITYCTFVQATVWQTASCTPAGPSTGGYPYVTTECIRPAATNYAATDSAPCNELAGPQTDPNTKVTTVCTKKSNTTTPAPPVGAGCTNNPGTSGSFVKTTCGINSISATDKSITACSAFTPTSPPWIKTACNQVPVGPMAAQTPVQWMTCSGGPNAGPYAYDTICDTTGVNNQIDFVSSATAGGTTSSTPATAAPWVDIFFTRPAGSSNQIGVAWDRSLGTCPSDPGTSPPYARSTCTTVPVSAPVAVDETTCPATTTSASSPFVRTYCIKQGVAGAFTCPGATPTGPPWTYERCGFAPTAYRNVPYGSCTPNSSAGLASDEVCRESVIPSFVPSCAQDLTPAGNNPKVTCSGPTVIANMSGPTDPASCPAIQGPQGGANQYDITCVTSPYGAYSVPAGVAACPTPAMNPTTFEVTTCSNPPATNFTMANSAPCTVTGSPIPGDGGNGYTTTQCFKSDTFVDMQGSTCAGTVLAQSGSGPEIKCVPNGGAVAQPFNYSSCAGVVGTSDASAPYDTVTACNSTQTAAPWNDFGGALCVSGNGSVVGEQYECRRLPIGSDVVDPSCGANGPDANGIITSCPFITGSGYHYKVSTTTTLTRTPMSGGVPSGPSVLIPVAGSPTAQVDIGDACYASAQTTPSDPTFPAKPPVPAGCGSTANPVDWPCTDLIPSAGGSSNSLADVAQYYYTTDLRPLMDDVVKPAGTGPEDDTARHQHMTTFVVALGVNGTLKYRPDYYTAITGDFDDIRAGRQDWPVWPDPTLTYANLDDYNNPKAIDDFWHTAVNGRGRFFSANDPTTVIDGLADALAKVDTTSAAGAADAVSSLTPTSTNNFVYGSSYESGTWIGDLEAFTINSVTGVLDTPRVWSAKALLDTRTFPSCDNRNIYLMRGSSLVDFAWDTVKCDAGGTVSTTVVGTSMNPSEQANFSAVNISLLSQFTAYLPGDPQLVAAQVPRKIVNFLRGQRDSEGFVTGSTMKVFRKRANVLGDLVDSQPVYVKEPFADYADAGYQLFKSMNSGRESMVYVGGNDGMLHAFYATVDLTKTFRGQEAWAVIPSAVLPKMYQLADKSYDRNHEFFVDGTPVASDVFDGTTWHTILVGGFSAGGKGYYALDITNPAVPQALWEFKHDNTVCPSPGPGPFVGVRSDCNLGLSFGKPVITKLGTRWVAIFTSGYNNLNGAAGDGEGVMYVVDAMTGVLQQKISTGAGDSSIPSGLAQINNYVDNVLVNNATLRAYGGDLLGNIWRFDFNAASPSATLVGTATKGAARQPITTRPELAELNGEPFLLVGTGKLLGETDVAYTAGQSVYGIRDKLTAVPAGAPPSIYPSPMRSALRGMQMSQVGAGATAVRTVACTTNCAKTDGWVVDLPEAGERVNVDMKLVLGTLVFASNVPIDIPCSVGGHSWFNQLDFRTGTAVITAPLSGSDGIISNYLADSLSQGFNVIERERAAGNNNPGDFQANPRLGDGARPTFPTYVAPPPFVGKRISWREVVQ